MKIPSWEDQNRADEWLDESIEQQKHKTKEDGPSFWETLKEIVRDFTW